MSYLTPLLLVGAILGQLDDLESTRAEQLQKLPGVARIDVGGAMKGPTHRIIHILDWHFVPEELFTIDVQHQADGKLSKEQIKALYEQHLKDVDEVQQEQMKILRAMVRDHGLRTVFVEGVTDLGIILFEARVAAFKERKKEIDEKPNLPRRAQEMLLELGAAGRLRIEGEKLLVLPLEDDDLLDAAKPITKEGKIRFDAEKIKAREREMVRRMLEGPQVAVVICGGSHDFAADLQAQRKNSQYLRLLTKDYLRMTK